MSFFDSPSESYNEFRRKVLLLASAARADWEAKEKNLTQNQSEVWAEELVCAGEKLFEATVTENALGPRKNIRRLVEEVRKAAITELEVAWSDVWNSLDGVEYDDEDGNHVQLLDFFEIKYFAKSRFDLLSFKLESELLERGQPEPQQLPRTAATPLSTDCPVTANVASPAQDIDLPKPGPKKRGRPQTIPDDRKATALEIKGAGGSNRDAAKKLYNTPRPSGTQVKSTSTILREYQKKKSKPVQTINKDEG